jgi:hypothetical protein
MNKRRRKTTDLTDDPFEEFERLAVQIGCLQAMLDEDFLTTDAELDRFFALIQRAQDAALDAELAAKGGRSLTQLEEQAVSIIAFVAAAGDAAREVWGASIGELIDGRRPS